MLLDQTLFTVDAKQCKAFAKLMDAPLAGNFKVMRLLAKRSSWEK